MSYVLTSYATPGCVVDDTNTPIPIDSLPQVLGYTSGKLTTITATNGVDSWVQTFTYDGSNNLTNISAWIKQ